MKYLYRFVLLILLLLPQTTCAEISPSGPEIARLFVDEMSRVFDIHFNGDTSLLKDGTHFSGIVMDEERMQLRFESRAFFEATGKTLSCIVESDRAEITLEATWDDAANDMGERIMDSPLFSFRSENVTESGFNIVFRSSPLEFEDFYYEIILHAKGEKSSPILTLGYYRKERSKEIQIFSVPGARWQVEKTEKRNSVPGAKVTMTLDKDNLAGTFGVHDLVVRFDNGMPVLTFIPDLYSMWSETNQGKAGKGYIRELKDVRVDQAVLPAFTRWRQPVDTMSFSSLSIPLDRESLALMGRGTSVIFDLVTTLDERVHVVFPLKNAGNAISRSAMLAGLFKVSPLMMLVVMEDYQGVEQAIYRGVDVNLALPNGMTALAIAVKLKNYDMIRLIETAPGLNTETGTQNGDGSLHIPAHYYKGTGVLKAQLDIDNATENHQRVTKRFVEILNEQWGIDKEKVSGGSYFLKDFGADSLDIIELVMALEEDFDIEISDGEWARVTTVNSAVDLITKRID